MPSAATPRFGLPSLTGLVIFGWSVVATAQAAPSQATTKPPNTDKPAAASTPKAAKAAPTPESAAVAKAASPKATEAPDKSAASGSTGETWAKPATDPAPAHGSPAPAGPASTWSEQPTTGGNGNALPPVYFVEPAPGPDAGPKSTPESTGASMSEDVEPMRLAIDEPPPPPVPRHTAPRTAFWLGARVGYFIPFGDLWGRCSSDGYSACDRIAGTKFSDVAATGPMVELDVGMRLGRNYMLYLGWERAQLGAADSASPDGSTGLRQRRAESDFLGVGFRLSANPDDIGLLLDLAIGARRFRAFYEGDVELQLTEAPIESRLGIGADIRINRKFALSPMLTLGLGSFGKADWVTSDKIVSAIPSGSDRLTHGWLTLQLGGHFDLAGSQ